MSATITVASFFSFFFVRPQNVCVVDTFYRTTKSTEPASGITSELLQRVPPFVYSIFYVRYKTGRDYSVPPLNFFRHCATFFSNFLLSPNGPPFKFFDILQQTEVSKSSKGSPFLVFRHCETFKILIFRFFEFFSKKFTNVSFVAKRSPLSSFLIFCSKLKFQKTGRVPLSSFRHCETVSKFSFLVFSKVFSKKFPNFFCLLQFFLIFCSRLEFQKAKRVPLFTS